MGLIREVFTFVDASHLISKLTTWDDRDRSIKAGLKKFNNDTAEKIAVDMQSGLINKIAATSAEVTDASGLTHVCPSYCQMWCMASSSGVLFLIGNLLKSIDEFNAGYNIS